MQHLLFGQRFLCITGIVGGSFDVGHGFVGQRLLALQLVGVAAFHLLLLVGQCLFGCHGCHGQLQLLLLD